MKYKSVIATRPGGPDVLQVIDNDLRLPSAGEVCIKVLAASVCRPDIAARRGEELYSGTPLGKETPFVPGYSIIGDVAAVGAGVTEVTVGDRVGVLTVVGGYTEYLKRYSRTPKSKIAARHRPQRAGSNTSSGSIGGEGFGFFMP